MNILELTPKTFGGNSINDGTAYKSLKFAKNMPILATSNPEYTERVDNFPVDGGVTLTGRRLPLVVMIKNGTISELEKWFDTSNSNQSALVATDGSAVDWYINARPVGFTMRTIGAEPAVEITLYAADPIWLASTSGTSTWSITGTGQTGTITVGGNKYARPVFVIGPTTARTGSYTYKRFVAIANRVARQYTDAINLPDSDWDTAALTTAKMQAGGEDCRVINDATGLEEYRWFGGGGIDSSTTRVFSNVTLPPTISGTVAAISNTGAVPTITLQTSKANLAALTLLAKQTYKFVAIDMGGGAYEVFKYTAVVPKSYQITGCTRAQKGTTNQTHAAGATLRHIMGYYILYGNAAATAPTTDDAYKPMFALASSTNTSHDYDDFYDLLNPNRLGQWRPQVIKNTGAQSELYTATQDTFADVASAVGAAIKVYLAGTKLRAPTADLAWSLYHPAGMTTLTWSGNKYRYATSWPKIMTMQKSNDGVKYTTIVAEATPAAADTWAALASHSAVSLTTTQLYIRLFASGTVSASTDNMAAVELTDLTATLDSNTVPLISFGAEEATNFEEFRITNTVASVVQGYIEVKQQIPVDTTITIDTENLEAYTADGAPVKITLNDESRAEWLPLTGGATNVLTYDETGANAITITTTWKNRNL